jgi:membrane-associated phospholipid phosphatase
MTDGMEDRSMARSASYSRPQGAWHPVILSLGCVLSVTLLTSWFIDPTRSYWRALDEKIFWILNDSLDCCGAWQGFWAVANSRLGDMVAALGMIGIYLHFMLRQGRTARDRFVAVGIMLTVLVIIGDQIGKAIPLHRKSGTMVHDSALRLSELVSWIPTKDISGDSFPGDHATVLLICAGVITYYLPRAYAVAAWLLAVAFMFPRLVSGAHWFTDDFVGSAAVAAFVLSCALATPLHRVMADGIERLIGRFRVLRGN